ncbi:hypothetical protein [[Actinomadura] parvosata]|uniref:hypothetical protein n=1 Tax=[Actinomadura] parvosata TaxID=1955412 RepID=UPI0016487DF7
MIELRQAPRKRHDGMTDLRWDELGDLFDPNLMGALPDFFVPDATVGDRASETESTSWLRLTRWKRCWSGRRPIGVWTSDAKSTPSIDGCGTVEHITVPVSCAASQQVRVLSRDISKLARFAPAASGRAAYDRLTCWIRPEGVWTSLLWCRC